MRSILIAAVLAIVACGRGGARRAAPRDAAVAVATVTDAAASPIDAVPGPDAAPPRAGEVIVHAGGGVAAFYLDRTETTVGEYRECVAAGGCAEIPARPDPAPAITNVSFTNASGYCAWRGKRLPTSTEWKRAMYRDAKRHYPWGDAAPDCDHAVLDGCAEDVPLPPGRPAGASGWGALDMIGNVAEWVDDGDAARATACVEPPAATALVMGGDRRTPVATLDGAIAQTIDRDPLGPDTGIRCARSMTVAGPDADLDPVVAAMLGRGWLAVSREPSATAAIAEVGRACPARAATAIAGELVGAKGWLVVDGGFATEAAARAAGGDVVAAPTRGLVRVVGIAGCDGVFDPGPAVIRLTTAKPRHRWQFEVPDTGAYQLWLEAGVHATLELICPPPHCGGPSCAPGVAGAHSPVEVVVPTAPTSRFEAPPMQMSSGCTCD